MKSWAGTMLEVVFVVTAMAYFTITFSFMISQFHESQRQTVEVLQARAFDCAKHAIEAVLKEIPKKECPRVCKRAD